MIKHKDPGKYDRDETMRKLHNAETQLEILRKQLSGTSEIEQLEADKAVETERVQKLRLDKARKIEAYQSNKIEAYKARKKESEE